MLVASRIKLLRGRDTATLKSDQHCFITLPLPFIANNSCNNSINHTSKNQLSNLIFPPNNITISVSSYSVYGTKAEGNQTAQVLHVKKEHTRVLRSLNSWSIYRGPCPCIKQVRYLGPTLRFLIGAQAAVTGRTRVTK